MEAEHKAYHKEINSEHIKWTDLVKFLANHLLPWNIKLLQDFNQW
jgi:TorA maturation chaperone TorD